MSKVTEARLKLLDMQLEAAVVEHVGTEADDYPSYDLGTYSVFIPGAVREHNLVKAADEKEAVEKVRACLAKKIDLMSESEANVQIDPDNLKVETKGKLEVTNG